MEPGTASFRPEYGQGDDDSGGTIGNKLQHIHVQGRADEHGQRRHSSPSGQVRYGIVFRCYGRLWRSQTIPPLSFSVNFGIASLLKAIQERSLLPGITGKGRLWPVSSAAIRRPDGWRVLCLRLSCRHSISDTLLSLRPDSDSLDDAAASSFRICLLHERISRDA